MVFWFCYICQYFLIPTVSALSHLNFTRTIILPSSWVLKRENDIWFYIKSAHEQSTLPKLTSSFATRFREVNFVRLTDGGKTCHEVNAFNEVNISVLFHKDLYFESISKQIFQNFGSPLENHCATHWEVSKSQK